MRQRHARRDSVHILYPDIFGDESTSDIIELIVDTGRVENRDPGEATVVTTVQTESNPQVLRKLAFGWLLRRPPEEEAEVGPILPERALHPYLGQHWNLWLGQALHAVWI